MKEPKRGQIQSKEQIYLKECFKSVSWLELTKEMLEMLFTQTKLRTINWQIDHCKKIKDQRYHIVLVATNLSQYVES